LGDSGDSTAMGMTSGLAQAVAPSDGWVAVGSEGRADVRRGPLTSLDVAPQGEIESKLRKRFIIL